MSVDDKNEEGMVGTNQGKIFFVCLKESKDKEKLCVQLVSKATNALDEINVVCFDPNNPRVFMSNCGAEKGDVKLISAFTMDTIFTFKGLSLGVEASHVGPVKFIASSNARKS
jgi:hypothetical protein